MLDFNDIFQKIGKKRLVLIIIALFLSFFSSVMRALFAREEFTMVLSCISLFMVYVFNFIPEYIIIKTFCKKKKTKIILFSIIIFLDTFFLLDYTHQILMLYNVI